VDGLCERCSDNPPKHLKSVVMTAWVAWMMGNNPDLPSDGVPFPIACKPEGSKEVRFYAQISRIQAGELLLPQTAPWMPEFVREIAAFPGGRHDDQADALLQLLHRGAPAEVQHATAGPIVYCDGEWSDGHKAGDYDDYDEPWGAR